MSYKYNNSIQFDLDHLTLYEDVLNLEEKKMEIDRVYAQAAKADEYEAKAKAFDYILNKKNEVEDDIYKFAIVREESAHQYLGYEVFKFISEYESGESDA